jgi:hypothetical protein
VLRSSPGEECSEDALQALERLREPPSNSLGDCVCDDSARESATLPLLPPTPPKAEDERRIRAASGNGV